MFATAGNSSGFGPRCYPRLLLRGDAESAARFTHMKAVGHRYEKWGFHEWHEVKALVFGLKGLASTRRVVWS